MNKIKTGLENRISNYLTSQLNRSSALGCNITRNIYSEVGYRYLYDDFRDEEADGFLYQMSLHGAQITIGLTF